MKPICELCQQPIEEGQRILERIDDKPPLHRECVLDWAIIKLDEKIREN